LWFAPDYIRQSIGIEKAFESLPYGGFKLHPFSHHWDFENKKHLDTLHSLFDYANTRALPVLIHTGESGIDDADRFAPVFG
jgi:predicted TIM-barrel fold metal-dependent hydrolase